MIAVVVVVVVVIAIIVDFAFIAVAIFFAAEALFPVSGFQAFLAM